MGPSLAFSVQKLTSEILELSFRAVAFHEVAEVRNVTVLALILLFVEFQVLKVTGDGMANHYLVVEDLLDLKAVSLQITYNGCDFWVAWRMLEVLGLDPSDPLSVVGHLCPRLHQSVENNVSIEVHDRNAGEPFAFFCFDPLTVQRQNLGFSKTKG